MDANKLKATDMLTESLKLIVTISTIFFGGLLAYRSNIAAPNSIWSYYLSLGLLATSAVVSVANINSLINKIFRGDEDAIKKGEVKFLNIISTLCLFLGIFSGAWFLSEQVISGTTSISSDHTVISDAEITVGKDSLSSIKVVKSSEGKVVEVTISPQK